MSRRYWVAALTAAATLVGANTSCDSSTAQTHHRGQAQGQQATPPPHGHDAQETAEGAGHQPGGAMATTFTEVGREERTFAVAGVPQVRIENFEGSVTVKAWDRPEVGFTAVKSAVDKTAFAGILVEGSQRGGEVLLSARFTKGDRRMRLGGSHVRAKGAYVEWEVNVPRTANVTLTTGDGPLSVTGVDGLVELRTGDGKIEVFDGRGRVNARTNDGLIRIARFDGEVEAREMGDHGINLDGRFARVTAETGGSAIWLALPHDADATLETDSDNVINDGVDVTRESGGRTNRWRIGRGGSVYNLRTGDGQIFVRRSANTQ